MIFGSRLIFIIAKTVHILIFTTESLMIIRMLLSLFAFEGIIYDVIFYLTEPFIVPVRYIIGIFVNTENFPIDISFMISYLFLIFLDSFLPSIYL